MSRDDHPEDLEEEFVLEEPPCLRPRIYEGNWQDSLPEGFDSVIIHLDGRVQADLDWKKERDQAQKAVEAGYTLLWNMHLGLFDDLIQPLTNQSQFLSLTLALEHFRDSLWKEFKSHTLGIALYQGSADFGHHFRWDEHQEQNLKSWLKEIELPQLVSLELPELIKQSETQQLIRLFCRDVAVEYLGLLATRLPDSLPAFLFLDASTLTGSPLKEMQILNPERFDRFQLCLKGHLLPFQALGWGNPTHQGYFGNSAADLPDAHVHSIGICIPPMHFYEMKHYEGLDEAIAALHKRSLAFKFIAECHLTSQWDGLDILFYCPKGLSAQGKRKLQGFCAAGGTVVSTGELQGFTSELGLKDWFHSHL